MLALCRETETAVGHQAEDEDGECGGECEDREEDINEEEERRRQATMSCRFRSHFIIASAPAAAVHLRSAAK